MDANGQETWGFRAVGGILFLKMAVGSLGFLKIKLLYRVGGKQVYSYSSQK